LAFRCCNLCRYTEKDRDDILGWGVPNGKGLFQAESSCDPERLKPPPGYGFNP
jgi:hypothetical protein